MDENEITSLYAGERGYRETYTVRPLEDHQTTIINAGPNDES